MLISIGRALSQERDIQSLLAIILRRACEVTNADAGSIYVVEGADEDISQRKLRFAVSQNDSRTLPPAGLHDGGVVDLDRRAVRAVGRIGSTSPTCTRSTSRASGNNPWGFVHDRTFDDKYRYQTRSVLAVPMISARAEVIGVIQLINKRAKGWITLDLPTDFESGVVPFDDVSEAYIFALASQAGIALENVAPLRGGQDAVRRLREGRGHRDRVARSDDLRSLRARRRAHGRPRAGGQPRRQRPLPRGPVLARRPDPDRVRGAAPRLRQGRRARARAGQGEEALRARARADPPAVPADQARLQDRGPRVQGPLPDRGRRASRSPSSSPRSTSDIVAKVAELDEIIKFILQANEPTVLEQGGFERIADDRRDAFFNDELGEAAAVPEPRRGELPADPARLADREGAARDQQPRRAHVQRSCRRSRGAGRCATSPTSPARTTRSSTAPATPSSCAATQIPIPARMMAISRHLRRADRERPAVQEGDADREGARHPGVRGQARPARREPVRRVPQRAGLVDHHARATRSGG